MPLAHTRTHTHLPQAIQPLLVWQHEQQQHEADSYVSEKLTMLLLLQEPSAWGGGDAWREPAQLAAWRALLDASAVSILDGEVGYLRQQLLHIEDVLQVSAAGASGAQAQRCDGDSRSSAFASGCNSCSSSTPVPQQPQ
jgi:hypothetical protein